VGLHRTIAPRTNRSPRFEPAFDLRPAWCEPRGQRAVRQGGGFCKLRLPVRFAFLWLRRGQAKLEVVTRLVAALRAARRSERRQLRISQEHDSAASTTR
jgi:hypothetical protein